MPLLTGGEAIVQSLLACGIDTVFGIPGMHNLGLYDALIRTPRMRHYLTRHEQAAVFMADGFFRASGWSSGNTPFPFVLVSSGA